MALKVLSCHSNLLMLLLVLAERVEIIMAITSKRMRTVIVVMVLYLKAIFKKAVGIKIDMVSMFLDVTQKAACGIIHCPIFFCLPSAAVNVTNSRSQAINSY